MNWVSPKFKHPYIPNFNFKTSADIMWTSTVGWVLIKTGGRNNNDLYTLYSCFILVSAHVSCFRECCFQALQPICFNLWCLAYGHEADTQPWETGLLTVLCSLLWGLSHPFLKSLALLSGSLPWVSVITLRSQSMVKPSPPHRRFCGIF